MNKKAPLGAFFVKLIIAIIIQKMKYDHYTNVSRNMDKELRRLIFGDNGKDGACE